MGEVAKPAGHNKNAPQGCEAFGAENESGMLAWVIIYYYLWKKEKA